MTNRTITEIMWQMCQSYAVYFFPYISLMALFALNTLKINLQRYPSKFSTFFKNRSERIFRFPEVFINLAILKVSKNTIKVVAIKNFEISL